MADQWLTMCNSYMAKCHPSIVIDRISEAHPGPMKHNHYKIGFWVNVVGQDESMNVPENFYALLSGPKPEGYNNYVYHNVNNGMWFLAMQ